MKKIGSGWTFDVYEYDHQKVLKKKKKLLSRAFKILKGDPRLVFKLGVTIRDLDNLNNQSVKIINNLKQTDFNFRNIANPNFITVDGYIQDKCYPVNKFLDDNKKIEEIIEKYIKQIKYFWGYGFADKIFNFTINNGLYENEDIALFDFNEIVTDKNRIISDIKQQKWLQRYSFKFELNDIQKEYFQKRMKEEITIQNLDKFWQINK